MNDSSTNSAVDDPFVTALRNACRGEPFTAEQVAELEHDMAQLEAGTLELVAHDDVPAWLEARAREEAALAAE
jgi:hypothetical protein